MNLFWNTSQSVFFLDPTLEGEAWRLTLAGKRIGLVVENDPLPVAYGSSIAPKTLIDRVQLGDGYEQVVESGVRSQKRVFELRWKSVSDKIAVAIQRFLSGEGSTSIYYRRPSEWFWWQPAAPLRMVSTLPFKVICVDAWSITPTQWNSNDVTASFEEAFFP